MNNKYKKIKLVLGTTKNETVWIVNTEDRKSIEIPVSIIKKYKLQTSNTEFVVESVSCLCKENGKIFRLVKWYGFKERTKESPNFKFE